MRGIAFQKAARFINDKQKPLLFALGFALIGGIALFSARAAVTSINFEAESGARNNGATAVTSAQASGGSTIKFGTTANIDIASDAKPLPFDMPSKTALRASSKKVYAHYFTPYPISLNNKSGTSDYYEQYLSPEGESSKHAAYGGLLRDRPYPRAVDTSPSWLVNDMKTEVNRAIAAGLDGFTVDLLGFPPGGTASTNHWNRVVALIQAANQVDPGFKIMLMPDASSTGVVEDPAVLAQYVASVANEPSIAKLPDGRLIISPFLAERKTATWWQDWISIMKTQYGITIALVPCFLDYGGNKEAFGPISYGFSNWGSRNTNYNSNLTPNMTDAHNRGKIWMQPVSAQDARPRSGVFDEASNSENLRLTWNSTISGGADWVQMTTWNDYSENTQFAPSPGIGWSLLDISSYYISQFKQNSSAPAIKRDVLYVSHRKQPWQALPAYPQTKLMEVRKNPSSGAISLQPRDTVEVLSYLAAPAKITVTIAGTPYTYDAPAGVYAKTYPLALGSVSAKAVRGTTTTANVTSPFTITNKPYVQDLNYYFVSSSRDGSL